jgi:hypothetical protein
MLLNKKEKEALVAHPLNKGLAASEIAKLAHASFTNIKKTRMKLTGGLIKRTNRKEKCASNQLQNGSVFLQTVTIIRYFPSEESHLAISNIFKLN